MNGKYYNERKYFDAERKLYDSKINNTYEKNLLDLKLNDYNKILEIYEKDEYFFDTSKPEPNEKLRRLMQENKVQNQRIFEETTNEFDVSGDLPEDALAKLQLLHGDCVVIPKDRLKDYVEKANR